MHRNFNDFKTKTMDIREYFQKEQKGFYRIIAKNLTVERRKQLYNAINEWHESELKLLGIADVVGRSEKLRAFKTFCQDNYGIAISHRVIDEFERYSS